MERNPFTPEEIEQFEKWAYDYVFTGQAYEKDAQEELKKEAKAWVESAAILAGAVLGG